jgi:hypothetical protein
MTPASLGMSNADLERLGYKLMVDASTPLLAMHRALRDAYAAMAKGELDPLVGSDRHAEQEEIHRTIDLAMLRDRAADGRAQTQAILFNQTREKEMSVFVIGGTGFIGHRLARLLIARYASG